MDSRASQTYWSHKSHRVREDFCSVDLSIREASLGNFGSFSLAYSAAVQPRVERFGDERGFIAFGRRSGRTFVLADPLASEAEQKSLIDDFLRRFPNPSFIQIHARTARLLQDRGFYVNEMGVDTRLNLEEYSFSGKSREWLRYADNWVTRRHFEIREFGLDKYRDQVEEISEAWRATRTVRHKEVRFLNRPIVMDDEPNVRRFGLFDPEGRLEAYLFLDPLFHHGVITGYVTCIKRRRPACNGYAETAIMKRAIETLQAEGVPSLWLGLSPFAKIENEEFHHNRMLHHASRYLYGADWFNRLFYNFRGHSEYKQRFQGEEHKVYYASRARFNTYRLISFASLCGVF
jgi:phosphatidylglycerol lysyltransferase